MRTELTLHREFSGAVALLASGHRSCNLTLKALGILFCDQVRLTCVRAFQPTIIPQDVAKGEDTVNIRCRFAVSIEAIVSLIQEKRAAFVLIVDCRDTFYREPFETFEKGQISLARII